MKNKVLVENSLFVPLPGNNRGLQVSARSVFRATPRRQPVHLFVVVVVLFFSLSVSLLHAEETGGLLEDITLTGKHHRETSPLN